MVDRLGSVVAQWTGGNTYLENESEPEPPELDEPTKPKPYRSPCCDSPASPMCKVEMPAGCD
jgi:hypothetical protein